MSHSPNARMNPAKISFRAMAIGVGCPPGGSTGRRRLMVLFFGIDGYTAATRDRLRENECFV